MKTLKNSKYNKNFNYQISNVLTYLSPFLIIVLILIIWQFICVNNIVPNFILPSPVQVIKSFISDFDTLMLNAWFTLLEAIIGLFISIIISFIIAVLMDFFYPVYKAFYPILIISQTIPTVAIAPLLVLWMGYGMLPKIVLVVIVCFFPITISLLESFKSHNEEEIKLLLTMNANKWQIFRHVKFSACIPNFFSGLKMSVSYSIISTLIAEWLGGNYGLGVYMTRVKKSYSFDKMFAVIFLISFISLFLIQFVNFLHRIYNSIKHIK